MLAPGAGLEGCAVIAAAVFAAPVPCLTEHASSARLLQGHNAGKIMHLRPLIDGLDRPAGGAALWGR